MPEIGLGERGRQGRRWGHLERAWPALDPAISYRADQVICPACQAPVNEECPGGRVHPERMHEALARARAGTLEPAPERPPATEAEPCPDCGRELTQSGRPKACSDACRCHQTLHTHRRCAQPVVPGTRFCVSHAQGKRWNDGKMDAIRQP